MNKVFKTFSELDPDENIMMRIEQEKRMNQEESKKLAQKSFVIQGSIDSGIVSDVNNNVMYH